MKLHKYSPLAVTILLLNGVLPLQAANQNWDGGSTANGNWTTAQNWSGDAVPGVAGGAYTLDDATFNASVTNGWGESVDNAIRIDTARSIDYVDFSGGSGSYFLGLPDDSVLTMFGILMGTSALTSAGVVATVQAPLEVASWRINTQFTNQATSGSGVGSGTLVIGGSFNHQTTSAFTLRLLGANTNNNIVLSDLADNGGSALSISKTNAGKWVLAGDNSFTGTVSIGQGTLSVGSLNSVSGGTATSNLGAPTSVANGTISMSNTAVLFYTGGGETSDRVINLAGTTGGATLYQAGTGTLTLTSNLTATGAGSKTLFLGSSTTAEGRLEGAIVDNSATNKTSVLTHGPGTWTMAGSNTYTGTTTVGGGTLKLDYGTNNTSKLSDTGVLTLSGGTLELSGGSHTEVVNNTVLNSSTSAGGVNYGAMTTITRSSGSGTIALGAITSSSNRGVLNIQGNIASTTTANNAAGIIATNTVFDSVFAVTMNGTDFATKDGSGNIVAYTGYTAFAGAMANNTVYLLTGNGSLSTNMDTRGTWLKIDTDGAGQSLNAGGYRQNFGAVLFTGAHDYEITSTGAVGSYFPILNYGTGNLTVTMLGGYGFFHYGTGTTILSGTTSRIENMGLYVGGGVVEIGNVSALGNSTANQTGVLDGGTLRGDTSGGDITMQYGANVRNFVIGDNNGRFDVTGGGNFTISGTVTSTRGLTIIGSNATSGTVVFSGSNTYSGGTRLDGGTWRLDHLNASGTGEILFNGGTLAHGNGIANDLSGRFANSAGQTFKIDTNGNDVTYRVGLNSVGGNLTKLGAGTLTLGGASTYTGTTTVSVGTLALLGSNRLADGSALVVNGGEFALGTASESVSTVTLINGTISGSTGVLEASGGFTLQNGTVSGILGGSGAVTKSGAGTVVLSGANTYSGGTIISGGTLVLSNQYALQNSTLTMTGGGNISLSSAVTADAFTIGALSSASAGAGYNIVLTNNANEAIALTIGNNDADATYAGVLSGNGSILKSGTGTQTLSGNNTYTGTTTITGGTIQINHANALGSGGSITFSGGELKYGAGVTTDLSARVKNSGSAIVVDTNGESVTWGTALDSTNTGGLTKNGTGTLELNAANTFTGATVVNSGTLKASAADALGSTANITVTGGSLLVTADNAIGNSTGIDLAGGTLEFSGNVTDTIGALTLSANSVIDLGEGNVVAIFADLFMGNYTLAVHNWTGTTLWNGGTGNNPDQIYFNRILDSSELQRISFYSDFGSSFVGTGFQLGLGSDFQYEVIAVPEAETWLGAALLLAGAGVAWMRGRRRREGLNMDGQDSKQAGCA